MIRKFFLLKLFLFAGAFGWGISILVVVLPWKISEAALQGLGVSPIQYHPMMDYWLRMAGGAFTFIGLLFAAAAVWTEKYKSMIPLLGVLSIFEGLILLLHGLKLALPPFPFYSDSAFCLLTGTGILLICYLMKKADK